MANPSAIAVISIFMLLMLGYGAKRIGFLKAKDVGVVNAIVINLTMPAFIFVSTHDRPFVPAMAKAPALGFAMEMVMVGTAYLIARRLKLDRPTTGAMMLVAAFGNTGFMGYPVVGAAYAHSKQLAIAQLTAVIFDEFAMALVLNSIGVAIAASFAGTKFRWSTLLDFLRIPLFWATVIALVLRTYYIPPVVMNTLGFIGKWTVPLAMISIGLSLSASSLKKYPAPLIAATVLKMAALPVSMYFLLPLIGVHGVVREVVVLESAMPAAVFTGVVASRYQANPTFAAGAVFVMTLASVVTIPMLLWLIR